MIPANRMKLAVCMVTLTFVSVAFSRPKVMLDGRWGFRHTQDDTGEQQGWYKANAKFALHLQVPGCWEAQGVGEETDKLRHHAIGVGWYRRDFRVPAKWKNKQIWLNFGGVHRSGKIWVNEQFVGEHWGYPVAFRFNITKFLKAEAPQKVVIAVDSRRHPERDPLTGTFDIIDYMNTDWGGIYEHVWLECTDELWIDNTFVQPDPANSRAKVQVELAKLDNATIKPATLWYSVRRWDKDRKAQTFIARDQMPVAKDQQIVNFNLNLDHAPLWTPESPNLLLLRISLRQQDKLLDFDNIRFGQRLLEIRGADFYLNGERFFLRGYGDDFNFPIELVPPADVDYWKNYFQIRKSFGFNGVRHHSMMPTESYLAAADEVGMLIQPELPIAYRGFFEKATDRGHELYRYVWSRYIRQMRNHPSVFSWCMGNELWHGFAMGPELYETAKRLDPTRPVIDSDGIYKEPKVRPTIDYMSFLYEGEHTLAWGNHKNKYVFEDPPEIPLIAHEMCNISVMRDPAKIARYTGVVKPFWYEQMRDKVEEKKLESYLPAMIDASRRLQANSIKVNFEGARLSPQLDGYHQWLFRDYWNQNSGFVDQFDDTRGISPAFARQFNSAAVLLWDRDAVSFYSGDDIDLKIYLSDFRSAKNPLIKNVWALLENKSRNLKPPPQTGGRGLIGPWQGKLKAPQVTRPQKFVIAVHSGSIRNDWPIWVFPKQAPPAVESDNVIVTGVLSEEVLNKLAAGSRVWIFNDGGIIPTIKGPFRNAWWAGAPNRFFMHCYGNLIVDHPAMKNFPHDGYGDFQMYNLIDERGILMLDDLPVEIEPIIWSLDIPRLMRRKAYLLEAKVGKGKLLFSTLNFADDIRQKDPAAQWLWQCLTSYVNSDEFQPKTELPLAWLKEKVQQRRQKTKTVK